MQFQESITIHLKQASSFLCVSISVRKRTYSYSLSPPLTWDLTSCLPSRSTSWVPPPLYPLGPFTLPLPCHHPSLHTFSPPCPSLPPYHLVSTFPYSLPANKGRRGGGVKLLLISGWPLPPRPHFKRLYLTPDMAVSNQNMRVQRTRAWKSVRIDAWLDVCVTAVWQETDRFTNYCTTSAAVHLSPDRTLQRCSPTKEMGSFHSCPDLVILSRVLTRLERRGRRWSSRAQCYFNCSQELLRFPKALVWFCVEDRNFLDLFFLNTLTPT